MNIFNKTVKFLSDRKQLTFDWLKRFANKPYANWVIFIVSFIESSFSPIPSDIVFLPACLAKPKRSFVFAFYSMLGSVIGGVLGYYIGLMLMDIIGWRIVDFYNASEVWSQLSEAYRGPFGVWFVALAAITPIPYKISTIAAGATNMDFWSFLMISILGRSVRSFLIAFIIYYSGEKVINFTKRNKALMAIIFSTLFIGGFFAIKFLY